MVETVSAGRLQGLGLQEPLGLFQLPNTHVAVIDPEMVYPVLHPITQVTPLGVEMALQLPGTLLERVGKPVQGFGRQNPFATSVRTPSEHEMVNEAFAVYPVMH
jgi:hypothetical protein